MNPRTSFTSLLVLSALLFVGPEAARAQTVAAGPYYAMPSWDQKLACSSTGSCPRFVVLSNWSSAAVLDRETGLVWQRAPLVNQGVSLVGALKVCDEATTGGRFGWRLPTYPELQSLRDPLPTNPEPALPPGHPFDAPAFSAGGFFMLYVTATPNVEFPATHVAAAILLDSNPGQAPVSRTSTSQFLDRAVWCVRGGQGADVQ